MTRNNIVLILLLVVLGIVGYLAFLTYSQNEGEGGICDLPEEEIAGNFVVKDTANVDRIVIEGTNGERITLERKGKALWYYQSARFNKEKDKWVTQPVYRARLDAVQLLLKTFYRIELRNYIAKSARENVKKRLRVNHKHVDIYVNGKLEKRWYVGSPSKDGYGTYMMLEMPNCGQSVAPYEMKMAAFHGSLNSRFFTSHNDWRYTGLWVMDPTNLHKVVVRPFEQPEGAFTAELQGSNTFKLYDNTGREMRRFDTTKVRDLFLQFKKLHFEKFDDRLSVIQRDSLLKEAIPYYYIETIDKTGAKKSLAVYKIKVPEGSTDMAGNPIEYNVDRLYGVTDDQDILIIQYFTFGGLFKNIRDFSPIP